MGTIRITLIIPLIFSLIIAFPHSFFPARITHMRDNPALKKVHNIIAFAAYTARSCSKYYIKTHRKILFTFPVSLPYNAPCSASFNCVAYFLSRGNSYAVYILSVFPVIYRAYPAGNKKTFTVKPCKILVAFYPNSVEHKKLLSKKYDHKCGLWSQISETVYQLSVGKCLSALSSSAGQYLSAVFGGHSFHKAVLFFSVELLGLISSFHYFSSFG